MSDNLVESVKLKVRHLRMKKNYILLTALMMMANSASFAGVADHWNPANDPKNFNNTKFNDLSLQYHLDQLPLKGEMTDHIAWSDSYWPSNTGGIAFRWNDPRAAQYTDTRLTDAASVDLRNSLGFTYRLYSRQEVQNLSYDELKVLSPAEKYDIFEGDYSYPTVHHERNKTNPSMAYWFGICDGWTPAAINHAEPAPINEKDANGVVQNPVLSKDGILIPFGSADVKAMMNHYYNRTHEKTPAAFFAKKRFDVAAAALVGLECKTDLTKISDPFSIAECADTNAGAFHLVMANQLGRMGRGFGIDVDAGVEIWNQPVFAYNSEEIGEQAPSPGAAAGTVREVIVNTDLFYSDDTFKGKAYWQPMVGTKIFNYDVVKYKYRLELDGSGNIIGGAWLKRDISADISWLDAIDRNSAKYLAMNDYEKPPLRSKFETIRSRPDQLWIQRPANFTEGFNGYYGDIYKIYRRAAPGPLHYRDIPSASQTAKADYDDYMNSTTH
jgi:hypothetical protein